MRVVKNVVIVLMLATAAAVLALGPRQQAVPAGRVVVDYWEKWTGNEGAQIKAVVDRFNDTVGRDKGIYVRLVSTSNIDHKTLTAIAAGVPPDIAGLWNDQMVQFASLDALTPLDELARAHEITADTYKKVYWDGCHWDGHLYCLVSTPATIALIYNKRVWHDAAAQLRGAGCDPDRPPQTLAELDRYAAALDVKDPSGRLARAGILPAAMWYLQELPYWFGGSVWDSGRHKFTLTSPACVAAYSWVQSYSRRLGVKAAGDFKSGMGSFDSPQNPFITGEETMEEQGPWIANFLLNQSPKLMGAATEKAYDKGRPAAERRAACGWAAAPFPSAVPGLANVCYAPFDMVAIPKGSKHPAEAFEFLAYLSSQPVMEHLCDIQSKTSPLRAVSPDFFEHHKNPYIKVWDDLAASPNARGLPQIPIWPEVSDELSATVQQLSLDPDAPVEPVLAALQDRLQRRYDAFMDKQRARRAVH